MSRCSLCCSNNAERIKVRTDLGPVELIVCPRCDRAKCQTCGRSLPGRAVRCPNCGQFIAQPGSGRS